MPRIAVIGAGWYGCHLGRVLIEDGHEVAIFEAQADIFTSASGHTQNRLHQGFHYPRSYRTREQSIQGFRRFTSDYPELSAPLPRNVFAVAETRSVLDFET